jgi:hypothetical protein
MDGLSVGEAKTRWEKFVQSEKWFRFVRRLTILPIALALLPLFRWIFPEDRTLLPMLAAFFIAMEAVLALDGPIQVFCFRKRFNQKPQTNLTEDPL